MQTPIFRKPSQTERECLDALMIAAVNHSIDVKEPRRVGNTYRDGPIMASAALARRAPPRRREVGVTQLSFSLWDGYPTDAAAKAARDARYYQLRKDGIRARRWVLKDQLRPYAGLGRPDGRSCDVYMLDVYEVSR